jgi:hypothetical protein
VSQESAGHAQPVGFLGWVYNGYINNTQSGRKPQAWPCKLTEARVQLLRKVSFFAARIR